MARSRGTAVLIVGLIVSAAALTGCDGGSPSPPEATEPASSTTAAAPTATSSTSGGGPSEGPSPSTQVTPTSPPTPPRANAQPKDFDAQNFGTALPADPNQYFPLVAGTQTLRDGTIIRGSRKLHHRRRVTVTDVVKQVDGVRTVAVLDQDIDAGQVSEAALDYYAQDRTGNVWYLGSYTEIYEGGEFVNAADAWLSGEDEATAGIAMLAVPQKGLRYVEARIPGRETIHAEVADVGKRKCVPFQCFPQALSVLEDGTELKYYGTGVGDIATEPEYSGGEQEKEELINVIQLTPDGLREASKEALRLDRHARTAAKRVFGRSAPAERVR
jgi:hypothetical protein